MRRLKTVAICVALFAGMTCMFASTKHGANEEAPPGVHVEEVALARLVPAVAVRDVEGGTCGMVYLPPGGTGYVQMRLPAAAGEVRLGTLSLDSAGRVTGYSEMHNTAAASTSVDVDVRNGTASVTNITEGGARMTVGRGTADEVLRSEALGVPARRIERMLARCGRPGETN